MLAKIVSEKREYYSRVFAKFNPGWFESVIVFDNENKRFELLDVYRRHPSLKRKVFIIDTDTTDMVEKKEIKASFKKKYKDCLGYSWVLDNGDLIKQIKAGNSVDEKYIKIAEELNHDMDTNEWRYVKNPKDADSLLTAAWHFHDATLESIRYEYNQDEESDEPSRVQVLFTGCWECDILLEFKTDVRIHFNVVESAMYQIMDSNILFHDGFVYWVDDHIESVDDIKEDFIYFRARSLAWKMITKATEE